MKQTIQYEPGAEEALRFEVRIPVFNNPLLWRQLLIVSLLSSGFVLLLLLGLNLFERQWDQVPNSFLVWAVLAGGLFAAFAIILMFLSRGIITRYTVSEKGVVQETLTQYRKLSRKAPLLALFLGGSRGATAAGAGMLARSREVIAVAWKEVSAIDTYPSRFEIRLKNQWRTVMQLVCLPENYQKIADLAQKSVSIKPAQAADSPFPLFVFSFLTLLCGVFLLPRLPVHLPGAFVILMMFFAFPAIWSRTKLRKISAAVILIALLTGVSLAFYFGEVNFSRPGTVYALSIEILSFIFFTWVALHAFSRKKQKAENKAAN